MNATHYFQRYSQRENVVTNNTLLLFSRLYAHDPYSFAAFINECLNIFLDIGVSFVQQKRSSSQHSVPDGLISQSSFKIVIETKLGQNYDPDQLERHLAAFTKEEHQILILLSPASPNDEFVCKVKADVQAFNKTHKQYIQFIPTTFEAIINSFESVLSDFDFQMKEIAEDFRAFLQEEGLLLSAPYLMRGVAAGGTLNENKEFNLYYDSKGYRDHTYIGLYAKGYIVSIGKLENIITADYDKSRENLKIHKFLEKVTEDQKARIIGAILKAQENNGWDITKNRKFFLVDKFHPTKFKQKHPIVGQKFFDLQEVLAINQLPAVTEIANLLREKVW